VASPRVIARETPGTTRKSSERRAANLLCCKPLKWGLKVQPINCLKSGAGSAAQTRLTLLSCQRFGTQCPSLQRVLGASESGRDPRESPTDRSWNRANPSLAKQAGRACAMGPNCPATSRVALALQAGPPQAERWSCLTPTLSSDESHANSGANSVAFDLHAVLLEEEGKRAGVTNDVRRSLRRSFRIMGIRPLRPEVAVVLYDPQCL
jgi:hypothetical protein